MAKQRNQDPGVRLLHQLPVHHLIPPPAYGELEPIPVKTTVCRHQCLSPAIRVAKFTRMSSYAHGQGSEDMLLTPTARGGNFFNTWSRTSNQQELLQSYPFL